MPVQPKSNKNITNILRGECTATSFYLFSRLFVYYLHLASFRLISHPILWKLHRCYEGCRYRRAAFYLTEHQSSSKFTWVLTWSGSCLCRQFTARQLTEFPNRAIKHKSESMTRAPCCCSRSARLTEDIMWSQNKSCLWAWNCRQDGWWAVN